MTAPLLDCRTVEAATSDCRTNASVTNARRLCCVILAIAAVAAAAPAPQGASPPSVAAAQAHAEATSPAQPIAAAPPPALIAAPTEIVANPYGFASLWNGGDVVGRGTLVALFVMSMTSWYVIVAKFIEQAILRAQVRQAEREFWRAPGIREGADKLSANNVFRFMVEQGLDAASRQQGQLAEQINLASRVDLAVKHAADAVVSRLQGGLALLATVGSTAPFIGLFGTVWGIYHALTEIGIAGQASIDKVAGPVGEALIMTAMGLAVAVPAVLGYNWLLRRNKVLLDRVRNFAADLLALLDGADEELVPPEAQARSA